MKASKVVLALLLGVAAVAAYLYFPNPLEQQEAAARATAPAGEKPAQ
jgi:Flp pilus assembly protein CpaB